MRRRNRFGGALGNTFGAVDYRLLLNTVEAVHENSTTYERSPSSCYVVRRKRMSPVAKSGFVK